MKRLFNIFFASRSEYRELERLVAAKQKTIEHMQDRINKLTCWLFFTGLCTAALIINILIWIF